MKADALRVSYVLGIAFVVAGGLVAAATGPLDLERGSWLAAYLVLVCGVAQCVLAVGHKTIDTAAPTAQAAWVRMVGWNLGNLMVILGALLRIPILADIGAIPLVVTLVLALLATRGARRLVPAIAYRAVLVILIVSIPIGLTLSHLRAA